MQYDQHISSLMLSSSVASLRLPSGISAGLSIRQQGLNSYDKAGMMDARGLTVM
jgi:hypothetical protein